MTNSGDGVRWCQSFGGGGSNGTIIAMEEGGPLIFDTNENRV